MHRILPLIVAACLTYFLFASVGAGAFLGFDAFPLIAASRVESLGDFGRIISTELMGFRYPDGSFYRPVVHLSFMLDDWWSDRSLDPAVFHRTDLLIAFVNACLLGALAARCTDDLRRERRTDDSRAPEGWAAATAIVVYLVHRAQLDVIPYAPRRADSLCILFLSAATYAALTARRARTVGVLAALAFFSKETGVIALPLVALAVWARRPVEAEGESAEADSGARGRCAPRRTLIYTGAALAIAIGIRTAVLGGLGGHAESGTAEAATRSAEIGYSMIRLWSAGVPGGTAIPLSLLALVIGNLVLAGRVGVGVAALGSGWLLTVLAITAFSGRAHAWYVVPMLPGVAVLCGTAVGAAFVGRRGPGWAGAVAAVALAAVLGRALFNAPQRAALEIAAPIAQNQFTRFDRLLREMKPGERRTFEPFVLGVQAGQDAPPVFLHAVYSLRALAELEAEHRSPTVQLADPTQPDRPLGESIHIDLVPGPPPASLLPPQ